MNQFISDEIRAVLPKLYATESVPAEAKIAYLKIFDPCGRYAFYVVEGQDDGSGMDEYRLFGWCKSMFGPGFDDWGYASSWALARATNRIGMHMMIDSSWTPGPIPGMAAVEA